MGLLISRQPFEAGHTSATEAIRKSCFLIGSDMVVCINRYDEQSDSYQVLVKTPSKRKVFTLADDKDVILRNIGRIKLNGYKRSYSQYAYLICDIPRDIPVVRADGKDADFGRYVHAVANIIRGH